MTHLRMYKGFALPLSTFALLMMIWSGQPRSKFFSSRSVMAVVQEQRSPAVGAGGR